MLCMSLGWCDYLVDGGQNQSQNSDELGSTKPGILVS